MIVKQDFDVIVLGGGAAGDDRAFPAFVPALRNAGLRAGVPGLGHFRSR